MKSIELEYPLQIPESSKSNPFDDTCVFESSTHSKSTNRDPAFQFASFNLLVGRGYRNGFVFQDAGTFTTRNENSLYRNINSFPVANINNSEFLSVKSGITHEMLQNLPSSKKKKKKNKKYIQGLSDSIFAQTALYNKALVTTGHTYPDDYEEIIEVTANKAEPDFGSDAKMPKPVAPDSDDSIYTTIKSVKPVSKFSMDPIMDDFASEPKKIKKSIERKSNNNSIIIESDSDATTIISNRSHMSFASKSSKNTFVANSTLNPSENATKATERSLGYFRDRIASKAKELSPESEQKQDLKLHKNKENKNINSNSINNNISLDPIVYKGTSPAQKDELEKRVVITPKADLNENQSFYTFHQPDPTDREMIKAPSKEHNSHGKTIDTNNHKIILPEIGFYTSKHQTQAQIDRDFNPYADSIKNFRKVYGKIDRTGSKQQARGRNHINDSQEMINPNYPLKPYKARPSSQVKALKKPEPKPPASTKNNRSSSTSNKSPMNSTLAIERHPTPKEMLPRKSTSNGIQYIMERIFSKDFEPPRSAVKNISPDQKNNPIDIQKTARIFEDGIRQRNGSIEHNVAEIDKIVRADKNFDEFLSNFESTYEKEMETYSRKISKESIKQFSSELKHYIREKSYSDLDHNTTTDGFSIHQASKTLFDQLFPASRNSSIPSKLEMIQEVEVDPLNATTSNFTPSKVVINRGEHHNRARSVGRNYRDESIRTGRILKVVNNPE